MAQSTAIVLAVGAITLANEAVFAPMLDGGKVDINWRVIPATAGLAIALAGLEQVSPGFAKGLAWLALVTVIAVPFGKAPTPLENATRVLGYA